MNIFYLDSDAQQAARFLVDKHIVKMPLETVQLLSTAHRILDGTCKTVIHNGRKKKQYALPSPGLDSALYQATHVNHPSAVWSRQSTGNYDWLVSYLLAMCDEYTARYGKRFKFQESGLVDMLKNRPTNLNEGGFTPPPPAMPSQYISKDIIESYRRYYAGDKWRFAKWKTGNLPDWMLESMQEVWHDQSFGERKLCLDKINKKRTPPSDSRILSFARALTY